MTEENIGACAWCGLVDHRLDEIRQCRKCSEKAITMVPSKMGGKVDKWPGVSRADRTQNVYGQGAVDE